MWPRFIPKRYTSHATKQTTLGFQNVGIAGRLEQEKWTSQQLAPIQAQIKAADQAQKEEILKLRTIYEREKKQLQRSRKKAVKEQKALESCDVIDVDTVNEVRSVSYDWLLHSLAKLIY